MRVAVGTDHGGFPLKSPIIDELHRLGHETIDCGAYAYEPADDYPDFAAAVARAVQTSVADRGVLICGSGVGASVAANKFAGIRAAVCHDTYSAHQGVEHDDMNVLCIGARIVGSELALELIRTFVGAAFSNEERHRRRLGKVLGFERTFMPEKEAVE